MNLVVFFLLCVSAALAQTQRPIAAPAKPATPATVKTSQVSGFRGGPAIDAVILSAIREDRLPGAVVVVGHNDTIVYEKAYGNRALVPEREPMTLDTIFDVASLTKVIATTSCVMKLVEQGKVRLNEKVTEYLPEFQQGQSDITVRHLLTHYSGMRPDLDLHPEWSGYETGISKALVDKPTASADSRFTYSDINFILLGEIVHRVGGKTLPEFARDEIFAPLGMQTTAFTPPQNWRSRIAPTEITKGQLLRGVVHDPTTRYMGGVAGHAGLFSTAADLSKFARMMLGKGTAGNVQVFSPLTVATFTSPQSPMSGRD
ncbi:MAG: serine hydrolase, partial [Bryobacteraceae bacterium]|nr:serine hydrolase [Bryobacteraceae bacterium]